jgi:hypothetical protein
LQRALILVGIVIVMSTAAPAAALGLDLGVAGGVQLEGDITDLEIDTDSGFSLGLELMFELPIVDLGAGYEYGFPRDTDTLLSDIEYHFFYGAARLGFIGPVYAMARLGYATVRAELPEVSGSGDGLSWSLGLGVRIRAVRIEVDYNEFDITADDLGGSLDYTNLAARVIYSF